MITTKWDTGTRSASASARTRTPTTRAARYRSRCRSIGRYAPGKHVHCQLVFHHERLGDGRGMAWQKKTDVMEIALDPQEEAPEEVLRMLDEALRALGISRISPPGNTWFLIVADDLTAERAQTEVIDPSYFVGLDDVSVREMSLSLLDTLRLALARARLTVLQMIGLRQR